METEYSNIRKQINIVYYALYVMYLLLVVIFGFLLKGKESFVTFDPLSQFGQIFSYVVIMYVIVSIPGALWWFKKQMKKVSQMEDEAAKKARYTQCAVIRVAAIGAGAVLAIIAFITWANTNPCSGARVSPCWRSSSASPVTARSIWKSTTKTRRTYDYSCGF